ncbi:AcrR family transcriptional regulator [Clostridium beijerinckii]|nr:TetR/AcrR family transcriptional regulator [Clostridium beijerinckii]NRY62914.1 AcrR family transcriptional regulator [Clostridium beijerinckii]
MGLTMSNDVKEKILKATMKVISKEKISGTRMHMIANEAHMSQANLHYHFSSKNDILISLLDKIQEEFSNDRKNYINLENKSVVENIRGFFDQKKNDILNKKEFDYTQIDYWVQGTVNEEIKLKFQNTFEIWRDSIREVLYKGDQGEDKDTKHLDMLPYLAVSLMLGASLQYLIDEGKFDLDQYFDLAERMILGHIQKITSSCALT